MVQMFPISQSFWSNNLKDNYLFPPYPIFFFAREDQVIPKRV